MKRFLSLFIVTCLLLACLASCNDVAPDADDGKAPDVDDGKAPENSLVEPYYGAPVKIVMTYSNASPSVADGGADSCELLPKRRNRKSEVFYNERNLPVKHVITYDDGDQAVFDLEYDEKNNLIRKAYSYSGKLVYEYEYIYDESNNLVRKSYSLHGSDYVYEYDYDENGNLIYDSTFEEWRDTKIIKRYTYDDNGKMVKYQYSTTYSFHNDTTYVYDSEGRLIEATETNADGKYTTGTHTFTYDADGRLIKKVFTCGDQTEMREYTYDASGNLSTEVYTVIYGNGSVYSLTDEYQYDEKNNLTRHVYTDRAGGRFVYEYAYDEYGNRVKRVFTGPDGMVQTVTVEYNMVYIPFELSDEISEMLTLEYYTSLG